MREREVGPLDDRPHQRLRGVPGHPRPRRARPPGSTRASTARSPTGVRRTALTDRERLAAEFAQHFALDHLNMGDDLWERLRAAFSDDELADLTMCCGMLLGLGRILAVVGVRAPDERILV